MRRCRICGCTDNNACVDGSGEPCYWFEMDLCSACVREVYSPAQLAAFVDGLNQIDAEEMLADTLVEIYSEGDMNTFFRTGGVQ